MKLFDGGGLYLEIAPGGGKLWRLKYRFDGKEKRVALGRHPEISLADARKRREAARELLANGIDPSEDRKAKRAERAVPPSAVAGDRYVAQQMAMLDSERG